MEISRLEKEIFNAKKIFNDIFKMQNNKYIKRQRILQMQDVFHFMCYKNGANLSYDQCNFKISKHIHGMKMCASSTAYIKKINNWNIKDIDLINSSFNTHIYQNKQDKRFCACDGSDVNLIKFIEENGLKLPLPKSKLYKKGSLSGIIDVDLRTVISCKMSDSQNERQNFISQLNSLTERDVVIFDAGYYSEEMIKELNKRKIGYIFRLPITNNFSKRLLKSKDKDLMDIFKISKKENINVRVIHYQLTKSNELCKVQTKNLDNVENYFILTSLTEKDEYSLEDIKNLYHKRWNVETYFRQLKYIASFSRINYKSVDMVNKYLAVNCFIFSFAAYFENLLIDIFGIGKFKKINKKISLNELTENFLYTLLKKNLTKTNLKRLTYELYLITKFLMPVQNDRHYRRVTKRPINGWSNMGSYFK